MTEASRAIRRAPRVAVPIQLQPVWKCVDAALASELVAFWLREGAITDTAEAQRRTADVVCVGRDGHGTIQVVSSVVIKVLPRLLQPMYYYRTFVAKKARGQNYPTQVYNFSLQVLQDYNQSLAAPESLGILIELESQFLQHQSRLAYIPAMNSVFIGYSPRGLHLRVSYFEGAALLPPMPPT